MKRKKRKSLPWQFPFLIIFSLTLFSISVVASQVDTSSHLDSSVNQKITTSPAALNSLPQTVTLKSVAADLYQPNHSVEQAKAPARVEMHPHPDDPAKYAEHMAMLALVPDSAVTNIAVKNGVWSERSTWKSGKVPEANANVLIPVGKTVIYNVNSNIPLHTIRVDGKLRFATHQNTKLVADTIVVTPNGEWEMGTASQPIASSVLAKIIFSDNGPINRTWDPTLISRGLISHGKTTIYGATKTPFLSLAKAPRAGETKLLLSQVPTNWKAGDTVVLTGAQFRQWTGTYWRHDFQEKLTLAAVNGRSITISTPLQYDHVPPEPGLDIYLANCTRNVIFASDNSQDIQRRGHVMFMHSANVDISYAGFYELGRSNKDLVVDDIVPERDFNGNVVGGTGNNVRGRYAVHFHRTGASDINSTPARVRGSAVVGSPGWGYVNHDSHVVMEDNVAYDVLGAAFVTEIGNEIGIFRRNIAIYSKGSSTRAQEWRDSHYLNDVGHAGHGFWFRGQAVVAENNIASNQAHSGFAWMNKGAFENERNSVYLPAKNLQYPAIANNRVEVGFNEVPIPIFKGNIAFASSSGIVTNNTRDQNAHHDGRSFIEDSKVWNCLVGMDFAYSYQLTIRNAQIFNARKFAQTVGVATIGVTLGHNTRDVVLENVKIKNYDLGINNSSQDDHIPIPVILVDSQLIDVTQDFNYDGSKFNTYVSKAKLDPSKLSFVPDRGSPMRIDLLGHGFRLAGTKIDSLGEEKIGHDGDFDKDKFYTSRDALATLLAKGYYSRPNGSTYLILDYAITSRLTGKVKTFQAEVDFDPHSIDGVKLGPNLGVAGKRV